MWLILWFIMLFQLAGDVWIWSCMLVKFFLFEVNTMPSFLLDAHARCHAGCFGYLSFWVNLHTFVSAFVDRDIRSGRTTRGERTSGAPCWRRRGFVPGRLCFFCAVFVFALIRSGRVYPSSFCVKRVFVVCEKKLLLQQHCLAGNSFRTYCLG